MFTVNLICAKIPKLKNINIPLACTYGIILNKRNTEKIRIVKL